MGLLESNTISYSKIDSVNGKELVSKNHFLIEVSRNETFLIDKSTNGTYINGKKIIRPKDTIGNQLDGKQELKYGDLIYVFGLKIIWLDDIIAINQPNKKYKITGLEHLETFSSSENENESPIQDEFYSRSPRLMPKIDTEVVELDAPPGPGSRRKQPLWMTIGPSLTMVLPMGIGILFTTMLAREMGGTTSPFMFMGIFTSATAAIVGVFWALMSVRYQKKAEKADEENRQKRYSEYLDRMEVIIKEKHEKNRTSMMKGYPHTKECMDWIETQDRHLWERNINHPDFLTVRLGIGEIPTFNQIQVPKERFSLIDDKLAERPFEIHEKYQTLTNVPILISLLENSLIGVISSERQNVLETARIFAMELAMLHSYTDVKMVFLVPPDEDWDFAKWLPHVWSEDNSIRFIANEPNSTGEVLYYLSGIIRNRSDEDRQNNNNLPHYVVFVGDPKLVEHEAVIKTITDSNQNLGFSTLLFYDRLDKLPNDCTVIVQYDNEYKDSLSRYPRFYK